MPITLLAATTSATQSDEFYVRHNESGVKNCPAHFTCPGLAGSETGTLQKKTAAGSFVDHVIPGDGHIITPLNAGVVAYAPGIYRVDKTSTAASVPVEVSTDTVP